MKDRNIFGGLFIIFLGLLFLLNNIGVIGWDIWRIYAGFWPLILIAVGLRLIFRRNVLVQILIVLAIFVLPVLYYFNYGSLIYPRWIHYGAPRSFETYNWNLAADPAVTEGRLDFRVGAGKIIVKASDRLAELEAAAFERPEIEAENRGGSQTIKISQSGHRFPMMSGINLGGEEWTVGLSKEILWNLTINTGAAAGVYDLSAVKFSKLDLDTGAGQLRVLFGDTRADGEADIDCGAGEVTLVIPGSVGAEVRMHTGIGKKNLSGRSWTQNGDTYTSENFGKAATNLRISLDAGVGAVSVVTE